VKLVACPDCHAQYDVDQVAAKRFACRCGTSLENVTPKALDARISRCAACGALVDELAPSCGYCGAQIVREPGELSLICPECFARNAEAARFCCACGVGFRPDPIPEEAAKLACPACEQPLSVSPVADVALAQCRQCQGVWVPHQDFDRLVARATEAHRAAAVSSVPAPRVRRGVPSAQPVAYRRCPECQAFMQRKNFRRSSGVIVDACHKHGTWLDVNEIEEIVGFLLSGAPQSEALEEEHRRANVEASAARMRIVREVPESTTWGRNRNRGLAGLLFDLVRKILE
jgi:Zn-finger nucleic acid-binding protein